MKKKILIVDDEESIRWVLKKGLEKKGYSVETAALGKEGEQKILTETFLIVFLDIMLPDANGIEILQRSSKENIGTPIVVMTAQGTAKNAINAMGEGAYDYITKPFDMEEIYQIVKKIEKIDRLETKVSILEDEVKNLASRDELIGSSKPIQEVFKAIGKVAGSNITVLITGESGTGKELVARALHKNSTRNTGSFIAINCAAIPKELLESELFGHEKGAFTGATEQRKGKFELADGGTLFLDEIGDTSPDLQTKLLRAIQEREFYRIGGKKPVQTDIRLITATNKSLDKEVDAQSFREDLFHRLNVFTIRIPPLRERIEDIPLLARHFVQKQSHEMGLGKKALTQESINVLMSRKWEGNVRELENAVKRSLVLSFGKNLSPDLFDDQIDSQDPSSLSQPIKAVVRYMVTAFRLKEGAIYSTIIREVEKELFALILSKYDGNQVQASKALGINRNTLARKMKEMENPTTGDA